MSLTLCTAVESDAARIADIHMAAFGNNQLLLAQFPSPAVREALKTTIAEKTIAEMRDPKWAILVVKNEQSEIISFAKWCRPVEPEENYREPPWRWPAGANFDVLSEWTVKVEAETERVLGKTPCYRLSFLGTDPCHQGKGAASRLVQWGLEHSRRDLAPVALESTSNAAGFYERFGFRAEGRISMRLHGVGENEASIMYEETCFVFRPDCAT
ncbi:hypothetical protein VTO42DRAFT_6879 [Malbranchea cinnamomea]